MFNEDAKNKFIEYKLSTIKSPTGYFKRMFDDINEGEASYGAEISDWNEKQVMEFYIERHETSKNSLIALNGRISEYVDFLRRHHVVKNDKNPFDNISVDALGGCVDQERASKQYINKADFNHDLQYLINPVDQFVMLCLWEGMKGKGFEELWRVRLDDIHKDSVSVMGRTFNTMSERLYSVAHEAADEFLYFQYGEGELVLQMYGSHDQIIKNVGSRQSLAISDDPKMIARQDKNIFRKYERSADEMGWDNIRPRTLMISGQVEYARRLAKEKNISLEEFVRNKDNINLINVKYPDVKIKSPSDFLDIVGHI